MTSAGSEDEARAQPLAPVGAVHMLSLIHI